MRLGLCLYRLGRGDYYYTIAEMSGVGISTVSTIVHDVCLAIVEELWAECVTNLMPKSSEEFKSKVGYMSWIPCPIYRSK